MTGNAPQGEFAPASKQDDAPTLDELRQRIDKIDETIHRQLIERSEIVEALIAVKRTDKPGAAFRPGREVDMMRRLVGRHRGILPITTVEHLWREIIATFTHMQAPYEVVVAPGSALRDVARFYFGFTVDFSERTDIEAVKEKVRAGKGSVLGVVANEEGQGAWWRDLCKDGVQVIARLPVIAQTGRPVDVDAFVLSMPLMDTTVPDMRLVALGAGNAALAVPAIEKIGGSLVAKEQDGEAADFLVALPFSVADVEIEALSQQKAADFTIHGEVGGYWTPISLPSA
ncbi:MAG: chorismate mutase [Cohaesibacter sp.]|nr:chorismate mutase [Cohaesibacter sp.]